MYTELALNVLQSIIKAVDIKIFNFIWRNKLGNGLRIVFKDKKIENGKINGKIKFGL